MVQENEELSCTIAISDGVCLPTSLPPAAETEFLSASLHGHSETYCPDPSPLCSISFCVILFYCLNKFILNYM